MVRPSKFLLLLSITSGGIVYILRFCFLAYCLLVGVARAGQ